MRVPLHPYVCQKYVECFLPPKDARQPGSGVPLPALSLRVTFSRSLEPVIVTWEGEYRLPNVEWVVKQVTTRIATSLASLRREQERLTRELDRDTLKELRGVRLTPVLHQKLGTLSATSDVASVYATVLYGGRVLLEILGWASAFQGWLSAWHKAVLREKRSVRSTVQYFQGKLPPDLWEQLKAQANWMHASLDRLSELSMKTIHDQLRSLGMHRELPGKQAFWTDLIRFAVNELKRQNVPERTACQAVRLMLNTAFPRVRHWSLDAVKSRYYRSL
jgi:hypothetical protein